MVVSIISHNFTPPKKVNEFMANRYYIDIELKSEIFLVCAV
jgi:hypothetical protein